MKTPAYIEIVFEDHTYTATVYDILSLKRFCQECNRENRRFRFGEIKQYGSISIGKMTQAINRISKYSCHDPSVGRDF